MKSISTFGSPMLAMLAIAALVLGSFAFVMKPLTAQAAPEWDVEGTHVFTFEPSGGGSDEHTVVLTQEEDGSLLGTGTGPAGAFTYTIDGDTDADTIEFTGTYTMGASGVLNASGTINSDGSIDGTWTNESGSGTWTAPAGTATEIPADTPTSVITIAKYIEGEPATASSSRGTDFTMNATWDAANIGAGSSDYTLGAANTEPFEAMTVPLENGADYTTHEVMGDNVGAMCATGTDFALEGYSVGDTLAEAEAATPSLTPPSFTNLQEDKFIIVWNDDCAIPETPEPPVTATTSVITITKYVEGERATASSSRGVDFVVNATWDAANIGSGSDDFTLDDTNDFQAMTVPLENGAEYSLSEGMNSDVAAACATGTPFALQGYSMGDTLAEAESATRTLTAPNFTDLQENQHVIIWNDDCAIPNVGDGVGELEVLSIEAVDTEARADSSFENGWEYIFHLTVPTDEQNVAMRFSNWVHSGGIDTIPAANNIRISSEQASNDGALVMITAADTYSANLFMTEDLNPLMDGLQVDITVEVAVPDGTSNGSYSTNYGVRSTTP